MSVSLDDIWSEPLTNSPVPSRARPNADAENAVDDDIEDDVFRPSKRRRSTLFLDGPEDEDEGRGDGGGDGSPKRAATGPSKSARPDVDSLFDDLEEETETRGGASKSSKKPFDLAAYRREAQQRAEKDAPASSFPRYAVQSSSPPRDGMDVERKDSAFGVRKGDDGAKEKRPIARLDETRLLGKDGLPALVQLCKDFKPRGKGHELADLNRLFSTYQFWAHKMYPKMQFADTVNRVEKLCHSRRMNVALSVWRDEVKGTVHGAKPGEDADAEMRSDKGDESGDEEGRNHDHDDVFGPQRANTSSSQAASSRASSVTFEPPVTRPPSSASEADVVMDDDDDPFDIDALLAAEEEMNHASSTSATAGTSAAKSASNGASASGVKTKGGSAGHDYTFENDDESEMWAALQAEELDAPFEDTGANQARTGSGAASSAGYDDNDDDAWDILDDIENEQQARTKPVVPPPQSRVDASNISAHTLPADVSAPTNKTTSSAANTGSNDDDWDDMYV